MLDLQSAIKRPFSEGLILAKGMLFGLPIPLLKLFFGPALTGYLLECGVYSYRGVKQLPRWDKSIQFWIDAFVVGFLSIPYALALVLVVIGIAFIIPSGIMENKESLALVLNFLKNPLTIGSFFMEVNFLIFLEIILIIIISLVFFCATSVAAINWFCTKKISDFYSIDFVWKRAFRKEYLIAFSIPLTPSFILTNFFIFARTLLPEKLSEMATPGDFFIFAFIIFSATFSTFVLGVFSMTLQGQALRKIDAENIKYGESSIDHLAESAN